MGNRRNELASMQPQPSLEEAGMSVGSPTIIIGGSASGGGGSSTVNDEPLSIEQSLAQLIANNSNFFQGTGAKILKLDAGTISTASPVQIGRICDGRLITADQIQRNQLLLNAIGAYARANGITIQVEAQLANSPSADWTYQWLGPAVLAGLPISGVENDDEIAASVSPSAFALTAQNMAKIVTQIVNKYPNVQIGQWEGGSATATTAAWWDAYDTAARAAGLPSISYVVADTSWNCPWVTTPPDWQGWLVRLSDLAKARNVQLNVLVDGIRTDVTGQQWTAQSEQHAAMLAAQSGGLSINALLIRTWQTSYPQGVLPLNEPTTIGNDAIEVEATYPLYQSGNITATGPIVLSPAAQLIVAAGSTASPVPTSLYCDTSDLASDARFAVTILSQTGLLSATAYNRGTVEGAGTSRLVLNGDYGEILAELRSLTLQETSSGLDTIDFETFGANGRLGTSQTAVLSTPGPAGALQQKYSFASPATGQVWKAATADVQAGVITSETFTWNATDQSPVTGGYQLITSVGIYEPLAEDGIAMVNGTPKQPLANAAFNSSNWNASAFNPAEHLSTVNVLTTTLTYSGSSGLLEEAADQLAPTAPTARIINGSLPNYFASGGTQVTEFNTGDNPNWNPAWGSWLGSVTSVRASDGAIIERQYSGGASEPYSTIYDVYSPYTGKLWERIMSVAPPSNFSTFVTGCEYITEYNTGDNPNWDYADWNTASKATETWQDYYLVNVALAPPPPTIPHLLPDSDSGSSKADNITNSRTPSFAGMAEVGDTITLLDGTRVVGTGVAANGIWKIVSVPLADGTHSITAVAKDILGNVSAASSVMLVNIDTTSPLAPTKPCLLPTSDSGVSSTDNITNVTKPIFIGTGQTGNLVSLYDGTTLIGSGSVTNGAWSILPSTPLLEGTNTITAVQTDIAGNSSVRSGAQLIVLDTTPPKVTVRVGSPTYLTGTGEPNSVVTLSEAGRQLAKSSATPDGRWTAPMPSLSVGPHTLIAAETDTAGNTGAASLGINVFAVPPAVNGVSSIDISCADLLRLLQTNTVPQFVGGTEAFALVDGVFSTGPDTNEAFLTRLYQGLLGRVADPAVLSRWDALMQSHDKPSIAQSFLNSPEYIAAHAGLGNAQFVQSLYQGVLGRAAEPSALVAWVQALNSGASRGAVAALIADSAEAKLHWSSITSRGISLFNPNAAIVQEDYETAFGRQADTGGLRAWTSFLNGGGTASQLAWCLTMSPEFQALHSGQTNAQYVESLYEHGLGRTADGGSLQAWSSALQSGSLSRSAVLGAIAQSPEAQMHWGFGEEGERFTTDGMPRPPGVSSGLYDKRMGWLAKANTMLIEEIYAAYAASNCSHDVDRIHEALVAKGFRVSRRRVAHLMSLGLPE